LTGYPGQATSEGTARLASRSGLPSLAYHQVDGLSLISVGAGTYLGQADDATDKKQIKALENLLASGCNAVDTAPNYRNGRSEKGIGQTLGKLIDLSIIARDEIFVSTKVGLLSEDSPLAKKYKTGMDLSCYDSDCIKESLAQSLLRLNLEQVDCVFVHNLELLKLDNQAGFYQSYQKLAATMGCLVSEGLAGSWGISSWSGFRVPESHRAFLSLADLLTIPGLGPRYLQLPLGIWGSEALTGVWQGGLNIIKAAKRVGLNVMANSSLLQGELLPLFRQVPESAEKAIRFVRDTEGVDVVLLGMKSLEHVMAWKNLQCQPPTDLSAWLEKLDEECLCSKEL
jgi:aryl-alcohol dehydrogenase-like predicted oxidoreductase